MCVATMANKITLFVMLAGNISILKPVFLPNLIDSLYLQLAQVPRGRDLAIFVTMTMTMTERRQTEPITLLLAHACEWGKNRQFVSHKTYFKLYYYPHKYKFVYIELPGHGQTTGITA